MNRADLPHETLADMAIFGGLSEQSLTTVRDLLGEKSLTVGEYLFREADIGRELYVVVDGELEILKLSKTGRETRVAVLGPLDMVGEMSMLDLKPRSASVRALSSAKLAVLGSDVMDALYRRDMKAYAMLVLNVARDLSRRLRVADGLLATFASSLADAYSPLPTSRK